MHRPSAQELVKPGQSQYSLVIGVAKRARMIAQEAEENKKELIVKPVQIAVEQYQNGDFKID